MNNLKLNSTLYFILGMVFSLSSCKEKSVEKSDTLAIGSMKNETQAPKKQLSKEFKDYWYKGTAEITSYSLQQARYGEMRKGNAVMIFVTEPFLPGLQVKADTNENTNIPVLKLSI